MSQQRPPDTAVVTRAILQVTRRIIDAEESPDGVYPTEPVEAPEFYTIDGAHRIFAQPVEKGRLGAINQNVTLAIRPEQIAMSMGASFPEDNLLKGVVTAIRFRGSSTLIEFDAGGLTLETRVFKVVGLKIGDECMLGLPPHRIIVLRS